jgi:hypothetical protein
VIETEVIGACQRFARTRLRRLGPIRFAQLISEPQPTAGSRFVGQWVVVFQGRGAGHRDDYFWVDDSTGRVVWQNGPPPWWLRGIAIPLWLLIVPVVFYIYYPVRDAWHYLRLPRCPHCGGKLRTRLARQCRWCGEKWHSGNGR